MPLITTTGGGSVRGLGRDRGKGGDLYFFTTATFTTGGNGGPLGPSLTQARNGLAGPETDDWKFNTAFFDTSAGIQLWTVPSSGVYFFLVTGASGGSAQQPGNPLKLGGLPAVVGGNFTLESGQVIKILVGQSGSETVPANFNGAGGGGGSFVSTIDNTPLFVAAGGMGALSDSDSAGGKAGTNGSFTGTKNPAIFAESGAGAIGGSVGHGGIISEVFDQRNPAGGGFFSNGEMPSQNFFGAGEPGFGFVNGGNGGFGDNSIAIANSGGFGGGAPSSVRKGGAAGGYSGGNGASTVGSQGSHAIGESATSFVANSATQTVGYQAVNYPDGSVTVEFIG